MPDDKYLEVFASLLDKAQKKVMLPDNKKVTTPLSKKKEANG
jgi:hypothetical protein